MSYRWCLDEEEPECNGPDCGHADDCPFWKSLMEEDDSHRKELEEYKMKKLILQSRQIGSKAFSAGMEIARMAKAASGRHRAMKGQKMANEKSTSETKSAEKRTGIINDEKFQKLLKEFTEKHKELFYYVIGKCGRASSMSIMYGIHLTLGQIERDIVKSFVKNNEEGKNGKDGDRKGK